MTNFLKMQCADSNSGCRSALSESKLKKTSVKVILQHSNVINLLFFLVIDTSMKDNLFSYSSPKVR